VAWHLGVPGVLGVHHGWGTGDPGINASDAGPLRYRAHCTRSGSGAIS
jgi:hypothetical protein